MLAVVTHAALVVPLLSPTEVQQMLAARARAVRIEMRLTQKTLASRAGVAYATLRRFERTGEISLKHLARLTHTLGRLDEFEQLLKPAPAASLAELESRLARPQRKRGSR
jgi:transcriptional regulator with XRE-family HTH domain